MTCVEDSNLLVLNRAAITAHSFFCCVEIRVQGVGQHCSLLTGRNTKPVPLGGGVSTRHPLYPHVSGGCTHLSTLCIDT